MLLRRLQHRRVPRLRATLLGLRPHHDQTTDRHDHPAVPHPPHERIEGDAHLRGVLADHAREHDVHILAYPFHDSDLGGRLERRRAAAIHVLPLLRLDHADLLAVAIRVEQHGRRLPIELVVARHALAHEAPLVAVRIGRLVRLAALERDVELFLEREPGERREENHDADVHDVAAVAAPVARDEAHERHHRILAVHPPARADALPEFLDDRSAHEAAQRVRDERAEVAHPDREERGARRDAGEQRTRELALEIFRRCPAPRDERPDAREREEREPERDVHLVEERRADGDFVVRHRLAENREERSPEHGERDADEQQVVEEEARLATHEALELRLRLEIVEPRRDEIHGERNREHEKAEEPVADARLRERVHARDDAAARDERAEDRQQERGDDERHVPLAQHPALLLHHDGVQKGGVDQPRQKRRVLDGIPRPVAAPSELDVRPPHAEDDARRVEEPRDQRPAAHGGEPPGVEAPRDERGDREGEGHRGADVAEVEIWRMDRHPRILQLRIEPRAVRRNPVEPLVGIGAEAERHHEEERDGGERRGDVRHQLAVARAIRPHGDRRVARENECPEEQRSRLPRPERRDLVDRRQIRARVRRDVAEGKVGIEQRGPEAERRENQKGERRVRRTLGARDQLPTLVIRAGEADRRAPGCHEQRNPERQLTNEDHECAAAGADV